MRIFDTIAEKLGTSRHTAMVLVLLGVLAAAWYISRHAPALGASTADTSSMTSPTTAASNTTANDTTVDSAQQFGTAPAFTSGVPGYQPPILPPTPAPPPQQVALSAYGGMYGSPGWNPPPIPPYPYPFGYKPLGR